MKDERKCPFLQIKTMVYCKAFPVMKMIPLDKQSSEKCLCSTESFQDCSYYKEISHHGHEAQNIRGFMVKMDYHFHPRHLWVSLIDESECEARVGIDDFAQKIIGRIAGIFFPSRGDTIKENAPTFMLNPEGRSLKMVAPVNGVITEINQDLFSTPSLINEDPYGEGWIFSARLTGNGLKNLFYGACARNWLNWEVERLHRMLAADLGITAADGGEATSDLSRHLTDPQWIRIASQFFG